MMNVFAVLFPILGTYLISSVYAQAPIGSQLPFNNGFVGLPQQHGPFRPLFRRLRSDSDIVGHPPPLFLRHPGPPRMKEEPLHEIWPHKPIGEGMLHSQDFNPLDKPKFIPEYEPTIPDPTPLPKYGQKKNQHDDQYTEHYGEEKKEPQYQPKHSSYKGNEEAYEAKEHEPEQHGYEKQPGYGHTKAESYEGEIHHSSDSYNKKPALEVDCGCSGDENKKPYEAPKKESYDNEPLYKAPEPESESIYKAPELEFDTEPLYEAPQPEYKEQPKYHKTKYDIELYHAPEPEYHAPEPKYKPEPVYHAPEPEYHVPEPKYKPEPVYHAPEPVYHAPEPEYHSEPIYEHKEPIQHYKSSHESYDGKCGHNVAMGCEPKIQFISCGGDSYHHPEPVYYAPPKRYITKIRSVQY